MSAALSLTDQLKEKCLDLKERLLANNPTMPGLLREIHSTLKQYPEQVTLLAEEDIQLIVQGLMKQTGVEFATQAAKQSSKSIAKKIAEGTFEL